MKIEDVRAFYAEEIRFVANLRTQSLVEAFQIVARERFLAPGPWLISAAGSTASDYWKTDTADPASVYHNVAIAIDPSRKLNNGQPGSLAMWMDGLELRAGGRVLHVGTGTGYYSAILAETVGHTGHVWAIEVDSELAEIARVNLSNLRNVDVVCADGWDFDAGPMDAILINAGVTHLNRRWLDNLAPEGCLVVPLTITMPGMPLSTGMMLKAKRVEAGYEARFLSQVSIFPSSSGRSPEWNQSLLKAIASRTWESVRSMRVDEHEVSESCFCHGPGICISRNTV